MPNSDPQDRFFFPNLTLMIDLYNMGLTTTKPVFCRLGTTKAQTSLRIRADCYAPLLFALWKASYLDLLRPNIQFSS